MGRKGSLYTNVNAAELKAAILREVDAANEHLTALRKAVAAATSAAQSLSVAEQRLIAKLKTDLDLAWANAHTTIDQLEFVLGHRAEHARDLLSQSQSNARETFDSLWVLVRSAPNRSRG